MTLVTNGTNEKFNSMTISWGSVGIIWAKPIVTIYVSPERYTHNFFKESDTFTVSFYGEENRSALRIMGSQSGRNVDKAVVAGLTPVFLEDGVTYKEAKQTLVCKKIHAQQMNIDLFPKEVSKLYEPGTESHYVIIGEVIN